MEAVIIAAKTERLPATTISTINYNKNALFSYGITNDIITTSEPLHYYPQPSSKPLYSYSYNTDTGIQAQEDGHLNHINTEQEALEARGSYSYTDAEGNTFQVSYVANENGFQPEGTHLSTASLIKKALQYIAQHPEENGEK
ncbi:larval cuticle protein lcp-17 [Lasius niger]|uniref:Larval cuticle protein lcp-17 n=1 Tax=Lasius niger TaxID=67767 RepID=A0A0J7L8T7_LASNI|nr:larval cuticle protein lcp-17 [Lasius niger]